MKINQVEELVGITKKNIRFYESQGLLSPERDPENGYREYSLEDVEQLKRIKLLRKLDIPCEKIRRVSSGQLPLSACLQEHKLNLGKRAEDLSQMQELCMKLAETGSQFNGIDSSAWLDRMAELEKGGVRFTDMTKSDVKRRKWGALISAAVCVLFMVAFIFIILWGNSEDPLPLGLLVFIILIPAGIITGIVLALVQRMKELEGGELDEAGKY